MKAVTYLYGRLRALPWPSLAGSVGNFALYESLLAGCTDRVVRGRPIGVSKVPLPDEETVAFVDAARKKSNPSLKEAACVEYFDVFEEIRLALAGRISSPMSKTK